ncbi:MAG: hypothetical protein EPO06_11865 [Burkholderiaceae bacterium]|nr:MAG: hypothetical protein EPO06_11865 [Burkholderiaceae bacterium]
MNAPVVAEASTSLSSPSLVDAPVGGWLTPSGAVQILPPDAYTTHHQAWLDTRIDGVGGSDISVILGLNGYESLYGLWLTKTGRRPPIPETPAMRRGHYLEPALVQWFADVTGIACRRTGTWAVDAPGWDWARVNPDRLTSDGGGLEAKAPNSDDWADAWKYGPALHAQAQADWCMAILGAPHWWIIADGGPKGLRYWRRERPADDYLDWMLGEAEAFWYDRVVADTPPDVDGSEATREALLQASAPPAQLANVTAEIPGCAALWRRRRELKDHQKADQEEIDLIENRFRAELRQAEMATDNGQPIACWSYYGDQKSRRFSDPPSPAARKRKAAKQR